MFAIVPILLEVIFVLLKPQELYEVLTTIQPLYTLPALIALGFVFDAGRFGIGAARMFAAPYLRFSLFFFGWCLLTVMIRAPGQLTAQAILFGTSVLMALSIAHCVQTWRLYQIVAGTLLALTLLLSFVGTHQATAPFRCHWIDPIDRTVQHYDGHPCSGPEAEAECIQDEDDHEKTWVCEHAGLMGTASVSGRIRFRGNLEDPNELALTVAIGLPFAIAFLQRKKSFLRLLLLLASLALVISCIFYSQSRGGQLVLLVVLGTYFMRRFGWKIGMVAGGAAAVPLLILASMSGRSSSEAEGSSEERIECLQIGLDLVKHSPVFGVGKGQFGEYHFLTAHNSYVLAAAETGLIGFAAWSAVIYLAVKIPLSGLRALQGLEGPEAEEARTWATAMLASMAGAVVGSFFLSFSFHAILWIYIGLSGALAGVLRRQLPDWRVRLSPKEMGLIVVGNIALLGAIFAYTKVRGGG
ncbi:MAG TPA: O-antigen ligase family protein [Labilithrix sp.]|nr:O-antigen ligase family protein [Labilithrix sp.]